MGWLNQHFKLTVLIAFITLFLILMGREWFVVNQEGRFDIEWHTTSMAELLHRDLGHLRPLHEVLLRIDEPELYESLDQHIQQKIGHLGLLMLNIYDQKGAIIYSNSKGHKSHKTVDQAAIASALNQKTYFKFVSKEEHHNKYGLLPGRDMAAAFVPIVPPNKESPRFVLEAHYDYLPVLNRGNRLLISNAFSLLLCLSAGFGILVWIYGGKEKLQSKVDTLESMLPICAHCKKIRIEEEGEPDVWMKIDHYLHQKKNINLSHGICNECLEEEYKSLNIKMP